MAAPNDPLSLYDLDTVVLERVEFQGNTVISDGPLAEIAMPYLGRPITLLDLEQLRRDVTALYVEKGYVNSGAVIEDQPVIGGVIRVDVVEGRLAEVRVTGLKRLHEGYVRGRLERGAAVTGGKNRGSVLNRDQLRDTLELLRLDRNIESIRAELSPTATPGEALLKADIREASPWELTLRAANDRPPSVGSEQVEVYAGHSNLTGVGDALRLRYGLFNAGIEQPEFFTLDDISLSYMIPVSPADTTVMFSFDRSSSAVIEEQFSNLEIESELITYAAVVRQPLYRTPDTEFAISAGADFRSSLTTLDGEAFGFSPGADEGRARVTALRLQQEFARRSDKYALSMRSTFSTGLNILDPTRASDDSIPDANFLSWVGQGQYVQAVAPAGAGELSHLLVLRTTTQLTNSPLLAQEQFSIGGVDTVRGYRANAVVRDAGVVGSAELRLILLSQAGRAVLTLVPFADVGYGSDRESLEEDITLGSVGIGAIVAPVEAVQFEMYYGFPLRRLDFEEADIQDLGLHFSLTVTVF